MATQVDVTGILDDAAYQVRITGDGVYGNVRVDRLVEQHSGREVEVPGHGVVTVNNTPEGVLGLLMAETDVYRVEGDLPGRFGETS